MTVKVALKVVVDKECSYSYEDTSYHPVVVEDRMITAVE
jgi:hypothetical protein